MQSNFSDDNPFVQKIIDDEINHLIEELDSMCNFDFNNQLTHKKRNFLFTNAYFDGGELDDTK